MRKIYYFIIIIIITACTPVGKISVTNIHDLAAFQEKSFIYSLPRTRIRLNVMALSHYTVPGPYNAYAEKYLGIKDAASISNTQWELKEINIDSFEESDPDHYYSLQAENPAPVVKSLVKFTEAGLIIDQNIYTPFSSVRSYTDDEPEPVHFTDLSIKRHIESPVKRTSNETSGIRKLPATKTAPGVKTVEEKAEEAANFIIKIRKRRFKLLAGQYDVFPEGTALETSVRELNKLEEEYLSLFIGKVYTDTIKRIFYYVPKAGEIIERNVFCRLSDETGIQDALSISGKPLVLELKNMGFTDALKDIQNPFTGPTYENIIYYRIPEKALVRVFYGSTNLIESELEVFQYGVLVPFNINMIIKK